ncbi:MAG: hypothetical protein AAF436_02955 [Myxococcota bacterium]
MSLPSPARLAWLALAVLPLTASCDQLGNPEQLTTGPTVWNTDQHELVTTTHSFRNPKTVRRLVEDGLEGFDYADASIGPSQTLTFVTVAPRRLRPLVPGPMSLETRFELQDNLVSVRRWPVPGGGRLWNAAFALPAPPVAAVTSVAP